jgi:hypothetical protein
MEDRHSENKLACFELCPTETVNLALIFTNSPNYLPLSNSVLEATLQCSQINILVRPGTALIQTGIRSKDGRVPFGDRL